uniref:RRM domain-containing protein n=1 Tax=Ananas comosus var. bracteatus TaxID=296719 RepID=A0A6V7PAN1_ANACO|nr:unnamed protein product [Ananas comosus var. bracteatus]
MRSGSGDGRNEKRKRERERALSNPPNPTLPISKRLRRPLPLPPATPAAAEGGGGGGGASSSAVASAAAPSVVIVTGLPGDCTVLELKSRLEIYGPVARTRVDAADGVGYVTFRSAAAADAAVAASLDPPAASPSDPRRCLWCGQAILCNNGKPELGRLLPCRSFFGQKRH